MKVAQVTNWVRDDRGRAGGTNQTTKSWHCSLLERQKNLKHNYLKVLVDIYIENSWCWHNRVTWHTLSCIHTSHVLDSSPLAWLSTHVDSIELRGLHIIESIKGVVKIAT